jgi:predicted adenine nucleotide alpha hydrolase (AANH) superfamily ATPase
MKILIHACCADCLLKFIDSIESENKDIAEITVYFYNSNIHPRSEYLARLKAIKKITEENKIKLIVADWSPREWFEYQIPLPAAAGQSPFEERETLKPKRCEGCWELRLRKTFEYAKDKNFDKVSSTLLTSHYQDNKKIEKIAKKLEDEYKIKFLVPKNVSKDLKTTGFYKQNYCGCCYSLVEAWGEKFK